MRPLTSAAPVEEQNREVERALFRKRSGTPIIHIYSLFVLRINLIDLIRRLYCHGGSYRNIDWPRAHFFTSVLDVEPARSQRSVLLFAMIFFGNLIHIIYFNICLSHFNKIPDDCKPLFHKNIYSLFSRRSSYEAGISLANESQQARSPKFILINYQIIIFSKKLEKFRSLNALFARIGSESLK